MGCVPKACNATQIQQMERYRRAYLNSSVSHIVARAALVGHGAYIDSCLVHEQNVAYCSGGNPHAYNCAGWQGTAVLGLTPAAAFSAWYAGRPGNRNITIDPTAAVTGPGANPTCPWKLP